LTKIFVANFVANPYPIILAVLSFKIESVRALVATGAKVNHKYERAEDTVLHMAVAKKYIDIVQILLE